MTLFEIKIILFESIGAVLVIVMIFLLGRNAKYERKGG